MTHIVRRNKSASAMRSMGTSLQASGHVSHRVSQQHYACFRVRNSFAQEHCLKRSAISAHFATTRHVERRIAMLEPCGQRGNGTSGSHAFTEPGRTLKDNKTCYYLKTKAAATAVYFAAAGLGCAVAAAKRFARVYCHPVHLMREPERPRPGLRCLEQMG